MIVERKKWIAGGLLLSLILGVSQTVAETQSGYRYRSQRYQRANPETLLSEQMNANTVSVITGTPGGTYFRIGADLAFVLDDANNMRVLPVLGKGAGENAYDIRFLKGIDLGFVRTDTLDQLRQDKRLHNVEQNIQYVAKLFNDELHVIAGRDIDNVHDLTGKKVTFDVKGSGTDYTGRAMFRGLNLDVDAINVDQPTAFEMLRNGEVAAVVSVAAKPVSVVAGFDPGDRFHLLKIPYSDTLGESYVPATLTTADYPKLVKVGDRVETLAVGTILAAYNSPVGSPRYRKVARFVEVFFDQFEKFLAPQRHPKWREVNLAASVPGWTRFRPAQEWLDRHADGELVSSAHFEQFLNEQAPGSTADKEGLYQAYLRWRKSRATLTGTGLLTAYPQAQQRGSANRAPLSAAERAP